MNLFNLKIPSLASPTLVASNMPLWVSYPILSAKQILAELTLN